MMRPVLLITFTLATICGGQNSVSRNRGYIFTAPKKLIAGETENVCLSLHNLEPPVHISIDLLASGTASGNETQEDDLLASVKSTLKTGIESCLELRVASGTKYSTGNLRLRLKFDKHPDYLVDTQKKVYIEHDALVTFVETDKPIYKPGQDVNIRVLTLKHDLKPWTKPVPKVWIETPSEIRVAQWTNITTENGMVQLSFPLSPEPSFGTWRIKVEKTRPQLVHTSTFEVKKYVLPRFQVTIGAPNYILADAKSATWKVCARYTYGEPVKGKLLLSLRPQTPIWRRKQTIANINYETSIKDGGCANYTVDAETLGLPHWKIAPNNIVLLANFTEAKSGRVETARSRTPVVHQPLKLEFTPHTPKYFKPGLPYHGKLRVLYPDGSKPAPNEKIQVCLRIRRKDEWQRSVVECKNFTSSNIEGFLDFIVPPQMKNIVLLSFVATAVDYPTKYYSPDKRWRVFIDQPSAYIDVEPWYSASSSFLSVSQGYLPITCGEKYSFNVMFTSGANLEESDKPIIFHYSINSKSDILVFGHVKYKPRKDTLIDYSEFLNLLGANDNSTFNAGWSSVHRFPLSVKITPSMAPVSELLLYYVRSDGEVVSSSHHIKVGPCFENQVKTVWHEDKQSPGSQARFHIEASASSLCGLSAVDKSTRFLTPPPPSASPSEPNLVDSDSVFNRLKNFHLKPDAAPLQSVWAHCEKAREFDEADNTEEADEIDHLPPPMAAASLPSRKKRHSVTYNAAANYVDAIQSFDDFGAIVMSDLILESRPCPPWRSSFGRGSIGPMSQEDIDEPDRMLKSVKAMPLAFQFNAPGSTVIDASGTGQDISYNDPMLLESQTATMVRSYFPETWIWQLVSTGKEGKATLDFKLPDSITNWIGSTICVSAKDGLGVSKPVEITAFQPFFLDVDLPYSVKRGEKLRLKVSLFNYMSHSLPVMIKLDKFDGLKLVSSEETKYFCLGPKDSLAYEYLMEPKKIGTLNVTIAAEVASSNSSKLQDCGPEVILFTRDEIVKPVLVKAEGFPVELTKSAFLCPKDFNDDSSLVWDLELPSELIEGSARARISVVGDVLGPVLENLDQLVRLPMGCGEQNMILFVPNIHAINYLDAINRQTGSEMRAKALRNMQKGYQRELNYRHPDGSYSAFGAVDESGSGSMWLTAFVVKSFAQARSLIPIDERDLKMSVKWIVRRQLENGCFPVVGQVFHKDMKGGLRDEDGSSSALTAYVLIALLESGVPLTASLVNNALYCLEKASASDNLQDNPYTSALTTYALALLEHPRANESLRHLLTRASRQNDLVWWEDKSKPGSLSLSIEMTSYAVLSLVKLGGEANTMEALRAVRWMSKKRNAEGGFSSTQDTVLGLEALTKYALAMANATATELSVLLTANELEWMFKINDENRMILSYVELPTLPTSVEVFAEGEGCVLVQSSLKYNKPKASGSEAFDLSASVENVEGPVISLDINDCSKQRLIVCSRYKLPDEESNMVVLEIGMVTGFVPDRDTLNDLLDEHSSGVKRFEENQDTLAIYFDKLTSQKTCISFHAVRKSLVDNPQPGNIKIYDYYQPELTVSTSYKFIDACDNKTQQPAVSKLVDENFEENEEIFEREKKDDVFVKQRSISTIATFQTTRNNLNEGSGVDEVDISELFSPSPILPNNDVELVDDKFSTTFFNVDHELATPKGIEGPVTVYVDAPTTTTFPPFVKDIKHKLEEFINVTSPCPRCEEKIPDDVEELMCAARNVVKVAIRRSRKARMLLDLSPSKPIKRLHATVELNIDTECYCGPVDKPGNMALMLNWMESRFDHSTKQKATIFDKTKVHLDEKSSIFSLPSINGVPPIIEKARHSCPRSP